MSNDRQNAQQLTWEGIEAAKANNMPEALQKLTAAVQADETYVDGWYWLGYYSRDRAKRIECMQRALQIQPDYQPARDALNRLMAAQKTPAQQTPAQPPVAQYPQQPPPGPVYPPQPSAGQYPQQPPVGQYPQQPPAGQYPQQPPPGYQYPPYGSPAYPQQPPAYQRWGASLKSNLQQEFSGIDRGSLLGAWWGALTFDSERSYEAYRGRTNFIATAIMIAVVVALAPVILFLVLLVLNGVEIHNNGEFVKFLFKLFFSSLGFAAQVTAGVFAMSVVSAHIGRKRFKTNVDVAEHFGLSGLYFVPITILVVALLSFLLLFIRIAAEIDDDVNFATAFSYTLFAFVVYWIVQFVYSNAAIYKLDSWRAILISGAALLVFGLVFTWLLPFTWPPIADALSGDYYFY